VFAIEIAKLVASNRVAASVCEVEVGACQWWTVVGELHQVVG
jgi:hypothetical protein